MTVIYLAGPMTGFKNKNKEAFHKAAATLRKQGHVVFNPAELDTEPGAPSGWDSPELRRIMKVELNWICDEAHAIALLPGWEKSLGAQVEWALAKMFNLEFIYL